MKISEVRIKLMDEPGERLRAFCSITFDDCFVVRDLKIIEGSSGPFVAMPSRKLTAHCPGCGMKNHLRSCFCNQCGKKLDSNQAVRQPDGRAKLYADIAHPINSACREMIQERVIAEFEAEIERSKEPGYVSRYDDFDIDYHDAGQSMRMDESHGTSVGSAPHHPPQSRPARTTNAPENRGPANYSGNAPENSLSDGESNDTGFGAGIFGNE